MNAEASARQLPYTRLVQEIEAVLREQAAVVPARLVLPLGGGGSLFVMPAADERVAVTKLITFTPDNGTRDLPVIQGDVVVFDVRTGQRIAVLDGPTVTARRTAAVSVLAARHMARRKEGPLLIVGAGVQGRAHLEAFAEVLGVREARIFSRTMASADSLVRHAQAVGMRARSVDDPNRALAECPLVVTTTPAQQVVMQDMPRADAFIAAVGAFTPRMCEWAPEICRRLIAEGFGFVDTRDADHEAGDLLQAGIDIPALPALADMVNASAAFTLLRRQRADGPVFFKSCGWAGWDLAAARCLALA
ncbi:MAG TPA: delta(1)-pyrroline-2-carboxylate reductase family protein [Rubrivivax sp.]|nr:delta(1)-pyrroline-2-carboxylate reductase family protein [Rubrivivax sp.]